MTNGQHDRTCIRSAHLKRRALVYIRQSSPGQVQHNTESQRQQRGLCDRAIELGWRNPEIIEDDLGVSATGYAERPGFARMLAAVTMRQVGIVFCIDLNRLSRNSPDWAHLIELCSCFETLVSDGGRVYDLCDVHDRLVVGIYGTIAEVEALNSQKRMRAALEAKAARGELRINLPPGLAYQDEKIVLVPDRRVQDAMREMFARFEEFTSVRQLALWYRDTGTELPRARSGREEVKWSVPTSSDLTKLLQNPLYAGAYVWGRASMRREYVGEQLVKRVKRGRVEDARVFIREHHESYIAWDRYESIRARISENRPAMTMDENRGAIREGIALLPGILRCGHCGGRMRVRYKKDHADYYCDRNREKNARKCISVSSKTIDGRIGEELCRAVEPLQVRAAVVAEDRLQEQRSKRIADAKKELEHREYGANRAEQQFNNCDPLNRNAADILEKRWEQALCDLQDAKEELDRVTNLVKPLSDAERERLEELAGDFPRVWNHPAASAQLRKRLLRAAIHEIVIEEEAEGRRLKATIHWQGGVHTRISLSRRARPSRSKTDSSLLELVRELSDAGHADTEIAGVLNRNGYTTANELRWTKDRVSAFRRRQRIRAGKTAGDAEHLSMNAAMRYLGISRNALLSLVNLGAVKTNQVTDFSRWRVKRVELDSERVRSMIATLRATGRFPKGGCAEGQLTFFNEED